MRSALVFASFYVIWHTCSAFVCKMTVQSGKISFNTAFVNVHEEALKFLASLAMLSNETGASLAATFAEYVNTLVRPTSWRYAVPAALYCFSNNAIYVIFSRIFVSDFFIVSSVRVGLAGILSWHFFRRTLSPRQVAALVILIAAVSVVLEESSRETTTIRQTESVYAPRLVHSSSREVGGVTSEDLPRGRNLLGYRRKRRQRERLVGKTLTGPTRGFHHNQHYEDGKVGSGSAVKVTVPSGLSNVESGVEDGDALPSPDYVGGLSDYAVGILVTLALCLCNSLANVWSEMLLKEEQSMYSTNLLLYTYGVVFNILVAAVLQYGGASGGHTTPYGGWNVWVFGILFIKALDGFLVAYILKHFDQFVKILCNQSAAILTVVLEVIVFSRGVSRNFVASVITACAANFLYFAQ